jgi:hypothetical protein
MRAHLRARELGATTPAALRARAGRAGRFEFDDHAHAGWRARPREPAERNAHASARTACAAGAEMRETAGLGSGGPTFHRLP